MTYPSPRFASGFFMTEYLVSLMAGVGIHSPITQDFFRFDADGKIIEHWDAIQDVPIETKDGNPMY